MKYMSAKADHRITLTQHPGGLITATLHQFYVLPTVRPMRGQFVGVDVAKGKEKTIKREWRQDAAR